MRNFLLYKAIGDAFGMRYEFVEHDGNVGPDDLAYGPHPTYAEYKPGHYTDDTQMAAANAGLLLSGKTPLTADDFINAWLEAYKRDPREGYSKYMAKVLNESQSPADFKAVVKADLGVTSGAAMRADVLGLLPDVEEVKRLATLQARTTHDTNSGVNASLATALTVHFLHYGGNRRKLEAFLAQHISPDWNSEKAGYTADPHNALNIVSQALDTLLTASTLSDVMFYAVTQNRVADTDTICALAMSFASRCPEISDDLPQNLRDGLENGSYGRDYLVALDQRLLLTFPPRNLYDYRPGISPGGLHL